MLTFLLRFFLLFFFFFFFEYLHKHFQITYRHRQTHWTNVHFAEPLGGASGFNWWEDICYIFLKKISSPNAFYVFLPLFKHQTSPYILQFVQKFKKSAFLFSFQTGTGSQWGGASQEQQSHMSMLSAMQIHYTLFVLFSS